MDVTYDNAGRPIANVEFLRRSIASGGVINSTVFRDLEFSGPMWSIEFNDCIFYNCDLSNTSWILSKCHSCSFQRCTFSYSDFIGANLCGCLIDQCDFTYAQLTSCDLRGVTLRNCRFYGSSIISAQFGDYLLMAPMGAGQHSASLVKTTFNEVDVEAALLSKLDFSGVDLGNTKNLQKSILVGCKFGDTELPLSFGNDLLIVERLALEIFGSSKPTITTFSYLRERDSLRFIECIYPRPNAFDYVLPRMPYPFSLILECVLDNILLMQKKELRVDAVSIFDSTAFLAQQTLGEIRRALSANGRYSLAAEYSLREFDMERRRYSVHLVEAIVDTIFFLGIKLPLTMLFLGVLLFFVPVMLFAVLREMHKSRGFLFNIDKLLDYEGSKVPLFDSIRNLDSTIDDKIDEERRSFEKKRERTGWTSFLAYSRFFVGILRQHPGAIYLLLLIFVIALVPFLLYSQLRDAFDEIRTLFQRISRWLPKQFWWSLCGFGERPIRLLFVLATSIATLALGFLIAGIYISDEYGNRVFYRIDCQTLTWADPIHGWQAWRSALLHAAASISTLGLPGLDDPGGFSIKVLAVLGCLWGIFLLTVYIWCMCKRLER